MDIPRALDVVYLWVDPWREGFVDDLSRARQRFFELTGRAPDGRAIGSNRFEDHGCLRYSMRSLAKNLQWFRRIHLVTSGEIPQWIQLDHPQINLVRHDQIFPNTHATLPTFNSHAIELCLKNIPDLSENFLYLNDDLFFMRRVEPSLFFDDLSFPRLKLGRRQLPHLIGSNTPTALSGAFCRTLLDEHFGLRKLRFDAPHDAIVFNRAIIEKIESIWSESIQRTQRTPFRTDTDFGLRRIYPYFIIETEAHVGNPITVEFSDAAFVALGRSPQALAYQLSQASRGNASLICINDETGEHGPLESSSITNSAKILNNWFETVFPIPAPWEHSLPTRP